MKKLMGDQDHIKENLFAYMQGFSPAVRDIFESFDFHTQIDRLAKAGLLYLVAEKFANIDLHPETVSNAQMGTVFEELIRKFAELSNETAGEHFTPREVIRLMVNLIFVEDDDALTKPGVVRSLYDPTAGTGGMLSVAGEHLAEHEPGCPARHVRAGAERRILRDLQSRHAHQGAGHRQHHLRQHPVERWAAGQAVRLHAVQSAVRRGVEEDREGDPQRIRAAGLQRPLRARPAPRQRWFAAVSAAPDFQDAACQRWRQPVRHRPERLAAVYRRRGLGESEIRRYVLENDLVEAIIGLPTDMFYNTGISTYIWIVSNRKPEPRKGKLQLIDASGFWQKMRKSLGSKRKELSDEHIAEITRLFGNFKKVTKDGVPISRIFKNDEFGYHTITVERPLRDEAGKIVLGTKGKLKGKPQPDANLRDTENVPLSEDIETYFKREVLPHAPDAWIDHEKTKVGYEIPFNRHFYVFKPPRELAEIDAELKGVTDRILTMIGGLSK